LQELTPNPDYLYGVELLQYNNLISIFCILLIIVVCLVSAGEEQSGTGNEINPFPSPSASAYNGDYVTITKPGKYTLERDIEHINQAGLLISASSVFLDGMGHLITPATGETGDYHVGLRILGYDGAGDPVQGVTVTNITISGENTAITIGEAESMAAMTDIGGSVIIRNMTLTKNQDGIIIYTGLACGIQDNTITNNTGTGLSISGKETSVVRNTISENNIGIVLKGADDTTLSENIITENTHAGFIGEDAKKSLITNNIFVNADNVLLTGDTEGYQFYDEPAEGTTIVGGALQGGNAWSTPDGKTPMPPGVSDVDKNGIFDEPFVITEGIRDLYPLVWSGSPGISGVTDTKEDASLVKIPESVVTPIKTAVPVQQTRAPTPVPTIYRPKSTISGLHVRIISDTIPQDIPAGTRVDVAIVLYNDGTETWYTDDAIGIQAREDAAIFGPVWMSIPKDTRIESKQEVAVHFTLTALKQPGTYTLIYYAGKQKEGVDVTFGRGYKKEITVT